MSYLFANPEDRFSHDVAHIRTVQDEPCEYRFSKVAKNYVFSESCMILAIMSF